MYKIYFYKDMNGRQPISEYLLELARCNDKDSRIKLNKIRDYIKALSQFGLKLGEPYIKHLDGDIWELRPIRDRILFVAWHEEGFILLHQFLKQTQKTPSREIEQAKREYKDILERGVEDELF